MAARQRKKYKTPRKPWQRDVLDVELRLLGLYGLRNKRELWRARFVLSRFRRIARTLLTKKGEKRAKLERELLGKLYRLGLIEESATVDDVLSLTVEDLLERRLQTMVFRKGLAKSIHQARHFIAHGHIAIGERVVTCPSYLVKKEEEEKIAFSPSSPFANPNHPIHKQR
jgi:small subunit ribosomal protein S4